MSDFNVSFDFSNQLAVITGGATGIGNAVANMFGESGANLALLDKNAEVVDIAQNLGKKYNVNALGLVTDVSKIESIENAREQIAKSFSKIDILINNAGIALLDKAESITMQDWELTMAINLSGVFYTTQCFVHSMIKEKKGKIVNLASQASVIALDKHLAYCASKAGVVSMTKVMALEWGKYNINVNAVSPTVVLTELGKKAWAGQVGEDMKKKIPRQRFALPEEIAHTILFLSSDAADMIHGENLLVDGGYSIQ